MAYDAGVAYLQITPSFRNLERSIREAVQKAAHGLGEGFDKEFNKAISKGLTEGAQNVERDVDKVNQEILKSRQKLGDQLVEARNKNNKQETKDYEAGLKQRTFLFQRYADIQAAAEKGRNDPSRRAAQELREHDQLLREKARAHEAALKENYLREQDAAQKAQAARLSDARAEIRERESLLSQARDRDAAAALKAFARTFSGKAQAGLLAGAAALPKLPLKIDDESVRGEVQRIRQVIASLGDMKVGVDVELEGFLDAVERQFNDLRRIAHDESVEIDVRTDAAAAATELGAVLALAERLDGKDANVNVRVDTSGAQSSISELTSEFNIGLTRLQSLIAAGGSIGTAIIPAAAAAAASVSALGLAVASVVAGIGVAAIGMSGIGDAVKAMGAAERDAQDAAKKNAQAHNRVAGAVGNVASAERSLANTRANVAEARVEAQQRINDAIRGEARTRREAAESIERAEEAVADATRSLANANEDQRDARVALNEALREGARDLRDLDTATKRNAVEQDKAQTALLEAKEEWDKLRANPRATQVELQQARDSYNERLVQIEELKNKGVDLRAEQKRLAKEGVEGTDRVKEARERVAKTDERASQAARRVARAQEEVRDTQLNATERVEDAERRVADARRNAASQQRQGAHQVAQAQQQVVDSQRSMRQAYVETGNVSTASMDKLQESMKNLSPAGQRFARFIFGLKDEWQSIKFAAQEGFLPGVQAGITDLLKYLPGFRAFVGDIAKTMGDLFHATVKELENPTWQRFFGYIRDNAAPMLRTLWEAGMNIAEAFANIFLALSPFNGPIGAGLVDMTEKFAKWAAGLEKNPAFQKFMAYVRENGPQVVEVIGDIVLFVGRLVIALAPLGELMLDVVDGVVSFINSWNIGFLTTVVTILAGIGLAILAWVGILRTARFFINLFTQTMDIAKSAAGKFGVEVGKTKAKVDSLGKSTSGVKSSIGAIGSELETAGRKADGASKKLGAAGKATGGLGRTFGNLAKGLAAGGLLTGGLILVTTLLDNAAAKEEEHKQKVDNLAGGLGSLGQAWRDFAAQGKASSLEATAAFREMIANNPELQKAALTLGQLGLSTTEFVKAAGGDNTAVVKKFNDEIARMSDEALRQFDNEGSFGGEERKKQMLARKHELEVERDAFIKNADAAKTARDALATYDAQNSRSAAMAAIAASMHGRTAQQIAAQASAWDKNQARIEDLTRFLQVFRDGQGGSAAKVDYLRQKIDESTGATRRGMEATENWDTSVRNLRTSVTTNGPVLKENTDKAKANRDAIAAAARASQDLFIEEVALGKDALPVVTQKHKDRITQLVVEAGKLGLDEKKTQELINAYGEVPEEVMTQFAQGDFDKIYDELIDLNFMQGLIKEGLPPTSSEAKARLKTYKESLASQHRELGRASFAGRAQGGPIFGPGTTTSDSIPILASNEEHMLTAAEVAAAGGHRNIYALRKYLLQHGMPAFAKGGAVRWNRLTAPFQVGVQAWKPTKEQLMAMAYQTNVGIGSAGPGGAGWQWQANVIDNVFPGMRVTSDYRAGDPGYHGRGRAIDMVFSDGSERRGGGLAQQVFNHITASFGAATKELIWDFSPWGLSTGIWNGQRHRFSSATSGPGSHNDHIHWAYDEGGWLPDTRQLPNQVMSVFHGKRQPDAVLSNQQWSNVATLIREVQHGNAPGGDSYNFAFADTALDADRLRSIQSSRDLLDRINRPNW